MQLPEQTKTAPAALLLLLLLAPSPLPLLRPMPCRQLRFASFTSQKLLQASTQSLLHLLADVLAASTAAPTTSGSTHDQHPQTAPITSTQQPGVLLKSIDLETWLLNLVPPPAPVEGGPHKQGRASFSPESF
jgi:hypothetical protein